MTPDTKLISRLRLMADAGGMLTRDRLKVIRESADRLEEYSERIAIMDETKPLPEDALSFPAGGDTD